jgi:VanZ family protein
LTSSALSVPAPPRHRLLAWLPTALWLALIAWFSSDLFSSAHTGSMLQKIIYLLYGPISKKTFLILHMLVRKAAHVTVYGILGGLAFYSWRATLPGRDRWALRWSMLALGVTLLAGVMDEFHQGFVASRTGSPRDVLLDLAGAVLVQIVIAKLLKEKR